MVSFPLRLSVVVALMCFAQNALSLSLPVSMDTSSTTRGTVTLATGKATSLVVNATQDSLLFFDLMGLPPSFTAANLVGARLRFYIAKVTKPGDLAIHPILDTWDESKDGAAPGIDANPIQSVTASRIAGKRFIIVDVTPTVKQWLTSPSTNHGLAVVAAGGTLTLKAILGAKEGPGIGQPAELELEVNAAGGVYQDGDPGTGKIDGQAIAAASIGSAQLADGSVTDGKIVSVSGGKVTGSVAVSLSANTVNGVGISASPMSGSLLPLDSNGRFPASVLPAGSGSSVNADLLDGLDSLAFAPASGSPTYVGKSGDTMTGALTLPQDGLAVGINQLVVIGGNVGIGTGTPTTKLTINGAVTATSFSGSGAGLTGVPDAAIPANVVRLDVPASFTAPHSLQTTDGSTAISIRAAPSQSNALQLWKNSAGATVASLSPNGVFSGDGSGLTNVSGSSLTGGAVAASLLLGSYGGVTGVGTITTGTWNGTVIDVAFGGTGASTVATARSNLGAAARAANADITSITGLTTPLSVGQGGTGSSMQSFVDLNATQTVGGQKTFTDAIIANLTGNASSAVTFTGSLSGDVTGAQNATVVSTVGGGTAVAVAAGAGLANSATSANTVGAIVKRDASGNFSAGTITGSLLGNATTATTATTATSAGGFTGALAGDVSGTQGATNVIALRGVTIAATAPIANQFVRFNGAAWTPGAVALGTDVTGPLPSANLAGIYSNALTLSSPSNTLAGDGAAIANLNATNLASGVVPNARLAGTYGSSMSLSNPGNIFAGAFTATADADFQGNLLKNSAIGMLLYHASFPIDIAFNKTIYCSDGFARVSSYAGLNGISCSAGIAIATPLDRAGSFLSARAAGTGSLASHRCYVIAGQGDTPNEGFGFKGVAGALKGVTIHGGIETEVDLATSFTALVNLLAVRRTSSVDFFVNGQLKGNSSTNLPQSVDGPYVLRAEGGASIVVGYLTIGSPMF